ncbi:MAG: hypothetical protein M3Y72_07215 [Acidobacteriota bacterium]|nr:hypothetical protein [Acidobacteriota bacterium]
MAAHPGHYPLSDLWAQHNEHRLVIPKILFLIDFYLFGGKNYFLVISIIVIQTITACLFCTALNAYAHLDRLAKITLYGLIFALLFSPVQMDNFAWGFQVQFILNVLATALSFYFFAVATSSNQKRVSFDRRSRNSFVLSLVSALCATLSLASGLFVWPLLVLAGVLRRLDRKRLLMLIAAWVAVTCAYLYHYQSPEKHGNPFSTLRSPWLILKYLSFYLGGSWISYGKITASVVGFLGIGLALVLFSWAALRWKEAKSMDLFFHGIIAFVLTTGTLTGLGRLRFGVEQGFSSRYQTVALLLWISVTCLSSSRVRAWAPEWSWTVLAAFSLLLWSPFLRLGTILGPYSARADLWHGSEAAALSSVDDFSMEKSIIEDPRMLPLPLQFLKQHRRSVFSQPFADQLGSSLTKLYSIDRHTTCAGAVESSEIVAGALRLHGWARNPIADTGFHHLIVVDSGGEIVGFGLGGIASPTRKGAKEGQLGFREGWIGYGRLRSGLNRFKIYGILGDSDRVCAIGTQQTDSEIRIGYSAESSRLILDLSKTVDYVFRAGAWWRDYGSHADFKISPLPNPSQFGQALDVPVIGDWDGTGKLRIGVFRKGQWWLDMNGNGKWDPGIDRLTVFGQEGDVPITGDWDGTGRLRMGVFRKGQWWLDMNGNGKWDRDDKVVIFGQQGDLPVVGDWDGSGKLRPGIFRDGQWWLDMNGDFKWTSGVDRVVQFGEKGDVPVIGNWDRIAKLRIGVFRNGHWIVDIEGNYSWEGRALDTEFIFGQPGDSTSLFQWPE